MGWSTILYSAELGLGEPKPVADESLGQDPAVMRMGPVGEDHPAHVPGRQRIPHLIDLPELGRERRRPQQDITSHHLAGTTHRVVVVTGQPCPTTRAVADLVLSRHVPYSGHLPRCRCSHSGQANDATTAHSCRYAFRVCPVYARNMAPINALR